METAKLYHLKVVEDATEAKEDPQYYIQNEIGYNYRMTNLQADHKYSL